jgi:hypothetical protein
LELIERFEKLGVFLYGGLFILFLILGRSGNLSLMQFCALPLGIVIGVVTLSMGLFRLHRRYILAKYGRRTTGMLAGARKVRGTYYPTVEFIADNGQVVAHRSQLPTVFDLSLIDHRHIGREVSIVYTLSPLVEVYIFDTVSYWLNPILSVAYGAGMIAMFLYLVFLLSV